LRTNFHPSTRSSRMAWAMQAGPAPSAPLVSPLLQPPSRRYPFQPSRPRRFRLHHRTPR
jgi:hypothetical protein